MKDWFPFWRVGLPRESVAPVEDAGLSRRRRRSANAGASFSSSAFLFGAAFGVAGRSLILGVDDAEPGEGFESCCVVWGFGFASSAFVVRLFNRVSVPEIVAKGGGAAVCTEATDVVSPGLASRGRLLAGIFLGVVSKFNLGAGEFR